MTKIASPIWDKLRVFAEEVESIFDKHMTRFDNPKSTQTFEGWSDKFWTSDTIRKCHLKIIEPTPENPKLWLLHINVFPKSEINIPILGFDIVAGPNKISGSFFDFSPVEKQDVIHPYISYFQGLTSDLSWKKPRELPEWALEIFSPHIVAAGNITSDEEIDQFTQIGLSAVDFYMHGINDERYYTDKSFTSEHNKYCANQKLNVQLHRSILSMGISEEAKNEYVNNVLFEEV